jgi:four helix bundle protein
MAKVERFEDLKVWQAARDIVNAVYRASSTGAFSKDYALRDQIRRAAVSIPSNIAEGFSRHSNKEFVQFLFIAKGSTAEVQSQLYAALDQHYISQEAFDKMYQELEVVAKQLSRLITYLKRSS